MIIRHHTPIKSSLSPPWKSEMPCIPFKPMKIPWFSWSNHHFFVFHGQSPPPGPIWSLLDPRAALFWCPGFVAVLRSPYVAGSPMWKSALKRGGKTTWWLIPLSKWVITPIIGGLTLLIPFITGVITHLLSGMSHQAWFPTFPKREKDLLL